MTTAAGAPGTVSSVPKQRIITAIVGTTLIVDQLTKWLALRTLSDGPIDIVPTVRFRLAHNSGFSFGTASGFGTVVGAAVAVITVLLIIRLVRETRRRHVVLLSAILGGALGNLVDRLFRTDGWPLTGEVVDFIDITWYAVFNIADAVLVVAVIAYMTTEYLDQRRLPRR